MSLTNVVIGIQARSSSARFPRKVFELIDGKPMLRHVIDLCDRAAFYMNRSTPYSQIQVTYAVLCPYKDEVKSAFGTRSMIIEGPEDDVLTRYKIMADKLNPDYIVRVTSDCPLLPPFYIIKLVKFAVKMQYDYCSNVDPKVRTAPDGYDVEVMSKRALEWADRNCKDPSEREHVTPILRSSAFAKDHRTSHVIGYLNLSHLKVSVDTPEDLERVRIEFERKKSAQEIAEKLVGKPHVHTI
jgi:spore coat polysaccharide biosynthesis protein SpsF